MREMKDSGIEWIGEIPRNWEVSRIKYVCNNRSEKAQFDHEEDSYLGLENVVGFSDKIIETDTTYTDGYYDIYKSGDVLFNKLRPYLGKVIIAPYDGFCTGEFIRLYNYQGDNRFLRYWMIDEQFITEVDNSTYGAKMPRANPDFILNMPIAIVSSEEQHRISTFLDAKCSEIDALTADIQSQIDTLEQYKRSVITEAVTKGLDRNVEMKESGIEWIGVIPNTWKVSRIGNLFHLRGEKNHLPMDEVQLLSLYTGIGVFPHGEQEERGNKAVTVEGYNIVKKNDIVVNIILAWMGAIGISEYDGVTSPAYDVYVPNLSKVVPHYFHYIFQTPGIAGECYKYGKGIMMMRWRTYSPEFKQIKVPFPSLKEQHEIADYLDNKIAEVDKVIDSKREQLSILDSYKKSVIYEYVTGKKEVPA